MNRVVAITGASAGIGRAIAIRLARDGASLAVCARRSDRLDAVAREIIQAGGTSLPFVADVAQDAEMRAFVERAVSRWGQLDVMVCNAGYGVYGSIDQVSADKMKAMMDVNYLGTFNAARAALPVFRRQGRGHIVIISSIVGKRGVPYVGGYAATKFAQVGLAECLRSELVGTGIHVTVVYPISTATEFHDVMVRESGFATRASGPRQSADRVAGAVVRAIDHPVPEVYPFRLSKALGIINSIAPGLCDRIVKKWGRKPIQ
jgi:NADP-dependent 3-hydroxy acid dehydrogenase YdfG